MEQPGFDGANRALHDVGHFFELVADAVDQFDDQALVRRQPFHALVQPVAQFAVVVVVGAGGVVFHQRGVVDGFAVMLAQALESAAVGDAHDPGGHLRVAAEVAGLLPGDPEAIVDGLFDDLRAAGQPRQEATQPAVIAVVHAGQRVAIAPAMRRNSMRSVASPRVSVSFIRAGMAGHQRQCAQAGKRLRVDQKVLATVPSHGMSPGPPCMRGVLPLVRMRSAFSVHPARFHFRPT